MKEKCAYKDMTRKVAKGVVRDKTTRLLVNHGKPNFNLDSSFFF